MIILYEDPYETFVTTLWIKQEYVIEPPIQNPEKSRLTCITEWIDKVIHPARSVRYLQALFQRVARRWA